MEGIFNVVLITSAYATVVGLVTILLKTVLKNKLTPQWHYLLWIVLVLKLLIPFGPESALSLFNVMPKLPQQSTIQSHNPAVQQQVVPSPIANETQYAIPAQQTGTAKTTALWKNILTYAWVLGVVGVFLWMIFAYYSLNRRIDKTIRMVDERVYRLFEACKGRMGISRNITLVIQEAVATPSLYGIIKPKILLTPAVKSLSEKEIEYILLHELAHYKRKDIYVNHLLLLFQIVHWFNPVLWYCFKRIRQDMEVATDERVLSTLEQKEYKDYGRALLSVLEEFAAPKLTPRLLGMADERKNIEKRIRMIKMAGLFKSKRSITVAVGVLCIVILSGFFLTNAMSDKRKDSGINITATSKNSEDSLLKHRSRYIGDASNVSNLLGKLSLGNYKNGISLATDSKPYGLTVNYDLSNTPMDSSQLDAALRNNALLVFVLIENVDEITFNTVGTAGQGKYEAVVKYSRAELQEGYENDLWQYSKDVETFKEFVKAHIRPEVQKPTDIDNAVSTAIKGREKVYSSGEFITQGHVILDIEEKGQTVKAYTIASVGWFGFENGIFTKVSGSGAIPTVMIFSKNEKGEYTLKEYIEPMDGSEYAKSIKKMFPGKLHDRVLSANKDYTDLARQEEAQAAEYLKSIGRMASVSANNVEKKLADIDVKAKNKLFSELTKYDEFLNNCPYWLGTRELIENGDRYIYETSQGKTGDGYDLITFRKVREVGESVVEERKYKIVGSEPQLME